MFVWTVSGIITVACFVIWALCWAAIRGITLYSQYVCKHEKYRENMACHAICKSCSKDLGFIQNLRDRDREREEV